MSVHLSVYHVHLSVCLSMSIRPSVRPSVCLSSPPSLPSSDDLNMNIHLFNMKLKSTVVKDPFVLTQALGNNNKPRTSTLIKGMLTKSFRIWLIDVGIF